MDKQKRLAVLRMLGLLSIIIGVAALFVAIFLFYRTKAYLAKVASAQGTIVCTLESPGEYGTTFSTVFKYKDATGQEHQITSSTSLQPPKYSIGNTVTVLYEPGKPEEATLRNNGLWFSTIISAIIGAASLIEALALLFVSRIIAYRFNLGDNATTPEQQL